MRSTSALYKTLRHEVGSYYETRVVQGDNVYGVDVLKSVKIMPALFAGNGPSIGNTWSTQCNFSMLNGATVWPRMAEFSVDVRLCSADGSQESEWITLGTYYTDQRSVDESGNLSIIAYDAMLLTEQSWTDKVPSGSLPADWPITAQDAVDLLALAIGIEIDSRTVLDDTVPFVGLDTTTTARDILSSVAAAMGANWHITPEGKFYLVPFRNLDGSTDAIAGSAVAGIAIVGTDISSVLPGGYAYLGFDVVEFSRGAPLSAVTGVELEAEDGELAKAGTTTGYVVKSACAFSDSDIATVTLNELSGFVYKPFKARQAYLDPAAEVGDIVVVNDEFYQICSIEWNLSADICANIGAAYESEVDHEFTIQPESAKVLKKALKSQEILERRVYSAIEQTESSILQTVGEEYATSDSVNTITSTIESTIEQTKDSFTIELNRVERIGDERYSEQQSYLRYADGVLTLGKSGDPSTLRQTNRGQGLFMNEEETFHVDQNEMVSPNKFRVPLGGSMQLGDFIFQPRSSGNMSLLWVGD